MDHTDRKRLSLSIILLAASLLVLFAILRAFAVSGDVPTYRYDSILLKLAKGKVRIEAADGHLAYEGYVQRGYAHGQGALYNPEGVLVYKGNFKKSKYEKKGRQYYSNGSLQYEGSFHENLFDGKGSLYRENESLAYQGHFSGGEKNGRGKLYDEAGNPVYTGMFRDGEVLYSDLLGKDTRAISKSYTGEGLVYELQNEYIQVLPGIDALCAGTKNPDTLDGLPSCDTVVVLKNSFTFGSRHCKTLEDLRTALGEPVLLGSTGASFPEAVAITELEQTQDILSGDISLTEKSEALFSDVKEIESYDQSYSLSIASFQKNGLSYTFVLDPMSGEGNALRFVFYSIQQQYGKEPGAAEASSEDAAPSMNETGLRDSESDRIPESTPDSSGSLSLDAAIQAAEAHSGKLSEIDARISTKKAKEDSAKKATALLEEEPTLEQAYQTKISPVRHRAEINTLRQKKENAKKNLSTSIRSSYTRIAMIREQAAAEKSHYQNLVSALYRARRRVSSGLSEPEEADRMEELKLEQESRMQKSQLALEKETKKLQSLVGTSDAQDFTDERAASFDPDALSDSLTEASITSMKQKALEQSTSVTQYKNAEALAVESLSAYFSLLQETYGEGRTACLQSFYDEARNGIAVSPTAFRNAYETFLDLAGSDAYGISAETAFQMLEEGKQTGLSQVQKDPYRLYCLAKEREEAAAKTDAARKRLSARIDAAADSLFAEITRYRKAQDALSLAQTDTRKKQARFDAAGLPYGRLQEAVSKEASAQEDLLKAKTRCAEKLYTLDKLLLGSITDTTLD